MRGAGRHRVAAGAAIAMAIVVVAATVAALAPGLAADVPTEQAERIAPPDRAVVIGDSAIAALRWVPGADNAVVGFTHTLDLESCRRLVATSCFGREGRRPPTLLSALDDHASVHRTLVVATGYNDAESGFADSVETVLARARQLGFDRIVWWTLRSDVDYVSPSAIGNHETFAANNAVLRALTAGDDHPDVVLADWDRYTADVPEWFVTDGVHYRQVGAWGAADYLTRKMAYLDGRACPFPNRPNEEPDDPCPDPDSTGPITDIEALYPVGEDGVLCYEIGADRRIECRFDTHVIRLERVMALGDVGDDVRALQTRLRRLGHDGAWQDGGFDEPTEAAVRGFQIGSGLTVNGVADIPTLTELGFDVGGIVP